jgi:hypothetical protein
MRTSSFRSLMMKFSTLSLAFGLAACGAPESEQNPLPEVRISAVPSEELRLQQTGQEETSVLLLGATAQSVQENLAAANPVIIVIGVQPGSIERGVNAEYMARGIQAQYMARGIQAQYMARGIQAQYMARGIQAQYMARGIQAQYMARGIQAQYMARGKQQAGLEPDSTAQGVRADAVLVEGVEPEVLVHGLRDVADIDVECVGGGAELAVCAIR